MKERPKELTCLKCGYRWEPRIERRPRVCPRCKNHDWDQPRRDIK
jgi:predicted Zn-ribbon and HTH transcriptional regulator